MRLCRVNAGLMNTRTLPSSRPIPWATEHPHKPCSRFIEPPAAGCGPHPSDRKSRLRPNGHEALPRERGVDEHPHATVLTTYRMGDRTPAQAVQPVSLSRQPQAADPTQATAKVASALTGMRLCRVNAGLMNTRTLPSSRPIPWATEHPHKPCSRFIEPPAVGCGPHPSDRKSRPRPNGHGALPRQRPGARS
jgi:hypothetical protein